MSEVDQLVAALKSKKKLVAMIAPSFPIVFDYPQIISQLRQLGFDKVMEVALGAQETNRELKALLKANPEGRYITSPCPTIVRMVKKQMPEYAHFFTTGVDSPMVASAKIAKKNFPDHQLVFIGPCIVKKLEAKEDVPELNILVVTYAELTNIFNQFNVSVPENIKDQFDLASPGMTRFYALDGGLSHSSGLSTQVKEGTVKTVAGWANCQQAIRDFALDEKTRLLDILFCNEGCINGPGIKSDLSTEAKKEKINQFFQSS